MTIQARQTHPPCLPQDLKTTYGDKILGTCTVEQAYGGMRSVKSMVYETSLLDPVEVCPSFLSSPPLSSPCLISLPLYPVSPHLQS
jgi:hypothetical protein